MFTIRTRAVAALSLALVGTALTGCGSSGSGSTGGRYVDGKTFTMAVTDDPGSLDPQVAVSGTLSQLNAFAYDTLVGVDGNGSILPELASSWKLKADQVTFQIKSGVTCADGTPFTAQTVADNFAFVTNPKNQSQYLGIYVPAGATATAAGSTVTLKLAAPSPFLLNGLANFPMVCEAGLKNRASLKSGTSGTGPYVLTKAVAGDHYDYKLRQGYTWGPGGATTAGKGIPAEVTVRVLSNETTTANELIAGSLNAARVLGPDRERLAGANVDHQDLPSLIGLQWYNHKADRVTSDPEVRMALTQALDASALRKVLTDGRGSAPTELAVSPPPACDDNSVSGALPGQDVDAAEAALDKAGWVAGPDGIRVKDGKRLSIAFGYSTLLGAQASSTAELAVQQWKKVGVDAKAKQLTQTQWSALFATGDWDVLWLPANTNSPDQLVPLLSGATPPKGNNFSFIENSDYQSHVATAMGTSGQAGCPEWMAAESALFKAADIYPFANDEVATFAKGASFKLNPMIVPTSVKMLG